MSDGDNGAPFTATIQDQFNWVDFMRKGETALLVIDPQNATLHEKGNLNFLGVWKRARASGSIDRIKSVIQACRKAKVPIFWIYMSRSANNEEAFPRTFDGTWLVTNRRAIPNFLMEGSWGMEIIDELKELIDDQDILIQKDGISAFEGTKLQQYLTKMGIRTLLVCGFITDFCVEATNRVARDRGYMSVLIGDACAACSEVDDRGTLERHKWMIGPAVTAEQIIGILEAC